ncbi:MAG: hypothetical protein VB099_10665 [Candidatus Limiplasma sp.]|nr:hypothetical protein [Candidatus Limiplasma sp.]
MKQVLYIDAKREGYGVDQIRRTMTVSELTDYLQQFGEDTPVYLRHDRGYTYGGITVNSFEDEEISEEE